MTEPLVGAVLDGRYKVIEPIAEGAMGSVYRGERLKLGRAVAIKIMHEELPDELSSRQRFEREAKLMALLEHPHCVSVIDFGVHDGKPFLVMELVRGTSLLDLLARTGRLEPARAADIARQVLSGLGHAHELGIIHRDIKPANLMITSKTGLGEQVRILDFGLARPTEAATTKLTTGIVVGTPNYMAPEQCKGVDIDERTDLYAVGVVLFEMLTGRKPFVAEDPIAVVRKHMQEPAPTLASVAPGDYGELEAVVARTLAKAPAERYASAQEMSAAIEAAIARRSFGHAVPQLAGAPAGGPQVATPSGWNVPSALGAPAAREPVAGSFSAAAAPIADAPPADPGAAGASLETPGEAAGGLAETVPGGAATTVAPPPAIPARPSTAPGVAATPAQGTRLTTAPGAATPGRLATPAAGVQVVAADPAAAQRRDRTDVALGAVPPPRSMTLPGPDPHRPIPALPFTRKQLAIGGSILGGILVIGIIASLRRTEARYVPHPPPAAVATAPTDTAPADPSAAVLARASDLFAQGDREAALSTALEGLRRAPDSAALSALVGRIYFDKLYWRDGVKYLRDAIRLDPGYRSDPEVIKAVLRGFITTPDVDEDIEGFLREDLGAAAVPYLEETAREHPRRKIRERAADELRRIQ